MGDNTPNTPEMSVIFPQNITHDLCNVKANTLIGIVYLVEILFSSLFSLTLFLCYHGDASTISGNQCVLHASDLQYYMHKI